MPTRFDIDAMMERCTTPFHQRLSREYGVCIIMQIIAVGVTNRRDQQKSDL